MVCQARELVSTMSSVIPAVIGQRDPDPGRTSGASLQFCDGGLAGPPAVADVENMPARGVGGDDYVDLVVVQDIAVGDDASGMTGCGWLDEVGSTAARRQF